MKKKLAFTLVELLIVVIILGILAAVVIPQFSDASTDAKTSSLQTNLATMRGQIELYRLQHNGQYPPFASFATVMTSKTNADHTTSGTPTLGPYMQAIPVNPLTGGSVAKNGDGSAAVAGCDFIYDYNAGAGTGRIWGTSATAAGTKYIE